MASTIFFNGRLISVPGSYSEVDASGRSTVGLSAAGIVAVLGTAEGGKPAGDMSEPSEFLRFNKPEAMRATFKSGDLREAGGMLFEPANDPDISGGAVEVVAMKVNPATQSALTLSNAYGDAIDIVSQDYGAFTEQIKVSVADGTVKGKLVTVQYEDQVEAQDDLGGDDIFKLKYDKPTNGWDTMTAQVLAGGVIKCDATRTGIAGLDGDVATPLASDGAVEVVATESGYRVVVYGLDPSGNPISETFTTIVGNVVGTKTFGAGMVLGAELIGTNTGAVVVAAAATHTPILTIPVGTNSVIGMVHGTAMYVSGSTITAVADGITSKKVIIIGKGTNGATLLDVLTLNDTNPVTGVGEFTQIDGLVLGDLEAARTIDVSAEAAKTTPSVQSTVQKVDDFFDGRHIEGVGGFVSTIVTGRTTYPVAQLDVMPAAVNCLAPAEPGFKADLYAIIEYLNQSNQLVDATAASGASGGAPDNTTQPQFLSGGSEGTAAFADWQAALNLSISGKRFATIQ